MEKSIEVAIYALHPIRYQTPLFVSLSKIIKEKSLPIKFTVLFGDDLSLRPVYYEHLKSVIKFDENLNLDEFPHIFVKNYAKDERGGFWSRVNPGIINLIIKRRFQVIMIHGYETFSSWMILFISKILRRKVIFRGESVLEDEGAASELKFFIKKLILPLFFSLCDAVMYSCKGNKNYFLYFGVKEKNLFKIPCAVDNKYFLKRKSELSGFREENRKKLGIPLENFVIIFPARFTSRKRPFDLINSISASDKSKVTLLFVGDGPERQEIERKCEERKINSIFTGFVNPEKLSMFYSISDLATVISERDPSPKALNEALVFSLPVIVSHVVGTAYDLVEDGKNGFIVPTGDIEEISKKINYLINSPKHLLEMGNNSLSKVQNWTIEAGAEGIIDAIDFCR